MTIAELKEILSQYDDDDQVVVAHHCHDYTRTVEAPEPNVEEAFLCGDDLYHLTNDEAESERCTKDGHAKRVVAFNF